jgi:hypothetical protein
MKFGELLPGCNDARLPSAYFGGLLCELRESVEASAYAGDWRAPNQRETHLSLSRLQPCTHHLSLQFSAPEEGGRT